MENTSVKDLMIPLEEYAVVPENSILLDALKNLEQAQQNVPQGRQQHRAVLVADTSGKIVGKIGHRSFLKALEPKYGALGDISILSKAGMSSEFIESMMDNFQLFQDDLSVLCKQACNKKVKDVMHPLTENIDENASLREAIHKIVMLQTLSILVKRGSEVVGVLRLSDLFDEIKREIIDSNA